ncbi:MAG: ABC transporter ATP-binding protein [Acidobacteria bacterium]|nr:ABC transporter ATP-binding protein [Acidobacteriota bacterium]MCI0722393.1 ABC transporter ATP-binding protein [Acidobacteriota bacterium]
MIQISSVVKRYGDLVAVDGVSLELRDEIFTLLGRNGAGKSTLIKMLAGIFPPDEGHIALFGHDVRRDSLAAKQEVGYLPENLNLYPRLTIEEFLHFLAGVRNMESRHPGGSEAEIRGLLEYFGLWERKHILIRECSLGMLKRVGLMGALLGPQRLIVLDEPLNGLDVENIRRLRQRLRELRVQGKTVLMASHILSFVEELSDRVGIIHQGRMRAIGSVQEIKTLAGDARLNLEEAFFRLTV